MHCGESSKHERDNRIPKKRTIVRLAADFSTAKLSPEDNGTTSAKY